MARRPDFDLASELGKPSFTPARADAPALVSLIVEGAEPAATRAAAALARLGDRAAIEARLAASGGAAPDDGARARLVGALGALARAGDGAAQEAVIARMQDASARVRRAAAHALGKIGAHEGARAALLARWDAADVPPDERRALAEALGKVGGDAALARLRSIEAGGDAELARRRDRALLMADRAARRGEESAIDPAAPPPAPVTVTLGCRAGLAPLLAEELAALGLGPARQSDEGDGVELSLAGPWSSLFASRLWATAAVQIPLPLAPAAPSSPRAKAGDRGDRVPDPDALAAAIARSIAAPETRALLRAWTLGPIRWRLGFASGHKRAIVWRVARDVTAAAPELINDPTATTWDFLVGADLRSLELVPRRLADPRFSWRVAEVPAASHPTVAAALAWAGEARAADRVWDPFCGAGAELVERARRGPYRALHGSDVDDAALAAARANLDAAGLTAALARGDARTFAPGEVDLILTNPPLGSRVALDAAALLAAALPNLASRLAPGGRLVWITPAPRRTEPVAERCGLRRTRALPVDLGGVRGQLERWDR
ncbi:MAG TPA: methyltransferase [Kofleriaceae bacterium]|nr:methyltransferase [Kofleriaceae bacterium]